MPFRARFARGFTLLELSVVLAIIGVLLGGSLVVFTRYVQALPLRQMEEQMRIIDEALVNYRVTFNRLPCPGDLTLAYDATNFGREANNRGTCTGGAIAANLSSGDKVQGALPTKTLGIPDSLAIDPWGRRIRYTVDKRYTENSGFVTHTSGGSPGLAFLGVDTTTQGNWVGTYGTDGYYISQLAGGTSAPSYGSMAVSGHATHIWAASSGDVRALSFPDESDRIAACWYSGSTFEMDITLNDGVSSKISLYLLDWDTAGPRNTTIAIRNAAKTVTYDTQSVSSYVNGKYLSWTINQPVNILITHASGVNSTISGVFFDPATSGAAYTLLSHGPNGHGGYGKNGGATMFNAGSTNTRELNNCACTNTAAAGTFTGAIEESGFTQSTTTGTDIFDDIALSRTRSNLNLP